MGNLNFTTAQMQQRLAQGYYDDIKAAGYTGTKAQLDAILAKAGVSMAGATASANGAAGLVPAPVAGAVTRYLRSDGTWQVPPDTNTVYTHPVYTAKASGLYKITVDVTGHVSAVAPAVKADITALGIPAQDTVYTHPTGAGNNHIPAGGVAGQFLKWSSAGVAVWAADNNTTYGVVTTTVNGLMSAADKVKLDICPTASGFTKMQKITQAAYDALASKDANTLYLITG